jgi:hypothetical protein
LLCDAGEFLTLLDAFENCFGFGFGFDEDMSTMNLTNHG